MKFIDYLFKKIEFNPNQGYAMFYYRNGETFNKCFGKVKDSDSDDITFDSNFRLASVSKQFIAFGIVKLVHEGKLTYQTNIRYIFNDLPTYFDHITIKQVLNHTSGIYDYENMEHDENVQISDEDVFAFLKKTQTTYFEPGSKYQYSNTGYILLGLIISKVTNRELNEYIETEIFKPAKMDNSKVNLEGITKISNRAYGHIINNDNYIVKDQYWCSATIGDGGLYSSINELKRWCKYLNNSAEFKDMKVPNIVGNYDEYGLGIRIVKVKDKEFYFHSGSTIGTNTLLLFSVDLDLCFLFLTNINGFSTTKIKELFVEYLLSEDC
jgi:CubicO group peptidase (beta-lactamase class C family)